MRFPRSIAKNPPRGVAKKEERTDCVCMPYMGTHKIFKTHFFLPGPISIRFHGSSSSKEEEARGGEGEGGSRDPSCIETL